MEKNRTSVVLEFDENKYDSVELFLKELEKIGKSEDFKIINDPPKLTFMDPLLG